MSKAYIIYETRTGNTKLLAQAVLEGLQEAGIDTILKQSTDVQMTELTDCDGIILGAATYHKDMIPMMKTFLFKLEKADLKEKIGGAFGAYGWSGEAVGMLSETMEHIYGMEVVEPKSRLSGKATGAAQYKDYGKKIAEKIKSKKK